MGSLYEALLGNYGDEAYYQQQDPFYNAGVGMARIQMPKATNNAEAIWGPALQGLLAGSLAGYGKSQAQDAAYQDYSSSPYLKLLSKDMNIGPIAEGDSYADLLRHDYSQDSAPDGWTAKIGRGDLQMAILNAQITNEAEQKKAEKRAEIELLYGPETTALKAAQEGAITEAKLRAETGDSPLAGIPKELRGEAKTEIQAVADKAKDYKIVEDLYGEAKDLGYWRASAGGIGLPFTTIKTGTADKLAAIEVNLQAYAQQRLGAEPAEKFRDKLTKMMPDWNDSDARIEQKKKDFITFVDLNSKATPVLDAYSKRGDTDKADKVRETIIAPDGKKYEFID